MQPAVNPYESPRAVEHEPSAHTNVFASNALSKLRIPVYGLLVVSLVHIVAVLGLVTTGNWRQLREALSSSGSLAELGVWVISAAVISAAWCIPALFQLLITRHALRLERLGPCRLTALIACIPVLSPCVVLGIPFGIWASIVLFQRSTAAAFDRPLTLSEDQVGVDRGRESLANGDSP